MHRDPEGLVPDLSGGDSMDGVQELLDPLSGPGNGGHHRNSQLPGQCSRIHGDPMASCLVGEVQTHHHPIGDLQDLEREVQIPLQPRGVHHHDGDVRASEEEEVPGHFLVGASSLERIGARQVHQLDPAPLVGENPLRPDNRLPGPVAGMLPETGERVEHRALPGIRVTGQCNEIIPPIGPEAQLDQALGSARSVALRRRCGTRH